MNSTLTSDQRDLLDDLKHCEWPEFLYVRGRNWLSVAESLDRLGLVDLTDAGTRVRSDERWLASITPAGRVALESEVHP